LKGWWRIVSRHAAASSSKLDYNLHMPLQSLYHPQR
jgi:hypothetical protein